MVKRAVLAGCNYINDEWNRLHGCVNDIMMAKDLLINRFKFAPADITLLYDEGNDGKHKQPTTKNIIAALKATVKLCKPGDLLYFHYSGHGSYQPDTSGDEKVDRQDELIIGVDFIPLTDDYLRTLIAPLPDGVKFVFISDSCFSGSMLDQPESEIRLTGDKALPKDQSGNKDKRKSRLLPPTEYKKAITHHYKTPADFLAAHPYLPADRLPKAGAPALTWDQAIKIAENAARPVDAKGQVVKKPPPPTINEKDLVLISGCMDYQTSADAWFEDRYFGALSYALATAIKNKKGVISYWDAAQGARNLLAEWQFEQNPTLTCVTEMANQPYCLMTA